VHDALLDAGVLSDLHWRFNERTQQWVAEKDWRYERSFDVATDLYAQEHIELCCDGLDTFATVELNGVELGKTDNMFRYWRWDVKPHLRPGTNTLRITFASVLPHAKAGDAKRHLPAWNEPEPGRHWGLTGRGYLRKQACQGGWDWGEMALTAGIYKAIRLEAWSCARLCNWRHTQHHAKDGSVRIDVSVTLRRMTGDPVSVRARLAREGSLVAEAEVTTSTAEATLALPVAMPELWWPNGMGEQPLYDLEIIVTDASGHELDAVRARLGLRVLELVREPDEWGTSFVFACNGRKFFAKGSNIAPLDQHPTSRNVSPRYRHLVESARRANMNLLRVWGGGYYLHQEFYDLCDELGICVWQDMMFGCGSYPFTDPAFQASVVAETRDNARVLRHHACLAVWCGNNELEMGFCSDDPTQPLRIAWEEYLPFFDELIPAVLSEEDSVTAYIPGSPHSGSGERKDHSSARSGDFHLWEIWFSEAPFENYRNYPQRFISEFGFQSLPSIETLRRIGNPEDLYFNSPAMEFHQRSQPGMRRIMGHLMDYFRVPPDLERQALLTQLVHGLGLQTGIEYWRSTWPRCAGATYWQLNDVWPAPTWSSVDVTGRWKAVHYFVQRMFVPVLVLGVARRHERACELHLVNDTAAALDGIVTATLATGSGEVLSQWSFSAAVAANCTAFITRLDLAAWVDPTQLTDAALWLRFTTSTGVVTDNLVLLDRPKHLGLRDPQLRVSVSASAADGSCSVEVSVSAPAFWVELSCSGVSGVGPFFDDNYVSVFPGQPWKTTFRPGAGELCCPIIARSLFDQLP
jgi:beta-mannosidase